ncbi:MAG TPA: ribosome assembly RNA-binding protein YhbY [Nitrosospira sp.]|jgi:putative YhbY family RNA-binding protein|nr:ribosome assembly RNA-binding protein YhbY [Nitrosospira sp.]
MPPLTAVLRRDLKARAHALKPVVWIGAGGLSESVLHEVDQGLKSHELIKIKVSNDEWGIRNALLEEICLRLDAAPVQHIGKMLVVYRPEPEQAKPAGARGGAKNKEKRPARIARRTSPGPSRRFRT